MSIFNDKQQELAGRIDCSRCSNNRMCDRVKYDCPKVNFSTLQVDDVSILNENLQNGSDELQPVVTGIAGSKDAIDTKDDFHKMMDPFDFYKDEREIYHVRTRFSVKAPTYDDAVKQVKQLVGEGLEESEVLSIDSCIFLDPNGIPMSVEQNSGAATVMVFDSNDRLVASNSMNIQPAGKTQDIPSGDSD